VCLATDSFWLEDWVSIGKLWEKHVFGSFLIARIRVVPGECRGWTRTCVWRFTDCKNVSSCWEITRRGPVQGVLCGTRWVKTRVYLVNGWLYLTVVCCLFGTKINFHQYLIFQAERGTHNPIPLSLNYVTYVQHHCIFNVSARAPPWTVDSITALRQNGAAKKREKLWRKADINSPCK
jgi:hypothetical protein